jgi:hypothetical protein
LSIEVPGLVEIDGYGLDSGLFLRFRPAVSVAAVEVRVLPDRRQRAQELAVRIGGVTRSQLQRQLIAATEPVFCTGEGGGICHPLTVLATSNDPHLPGPATLGRRR